MIKQKYVYWKDDDTWLGYLDDFPDYWTQGKTEDDLREHLADRHGGKHDWYQNPRTHISQPVPRHREIREALAKHIIKMPGDA